MELKMRKEEGQPTDIAVGRPVNGISINGLEYLLNEDGDTMRFANKPQAIIFLKANGLTDEQIEGFRFLNYEKLNQDIFEDVE